MLTLRQRGHVTPGAIWPDGAICGQLRYYGCTRARKYWLVLILKSTSTSTKIPYEYENDLAVKKRRQLNVLFKCKELESSDELSTAGETSYCDLIQERQPTFTSC